MTLIEFSMFVAGVIWGIFIIEPIWRIARTIYKNAKEAQNGNNS
jgi:TRAP-type C4-dicarboxylate transport system permease small subunit